MPYSRLIPTLVVALLVPLAAWSQDPPPAAPAEPSKSLADNVITETLIKLRLRERIAADVEQDVDMLNQKFSLQGSYYKDAGHKVRLQLNLKGLGETGSLMLQVCDGKVLWDYQKVLGMQTYRRRDMTQILKRIEDPALDDVRYMITSQLGFGGPEAMITGLQKAIRFDQFADKEVDGVASYVLGGTWKDRAGLLGANDRPLPPTAPLPPYIPSNVQLFIDKATLWPYRIVMIGNRPSMLAEEARQVDPITGRTVGIKKGPPKVDPSKITLRYTLKDDSEVKPELFEFSAPADASTANLIDETDDFLRSLDQAIQGILARKKAEAAKAEGEPVFKTPSLDAPSPSPSTDLPAPK